MFRHLCQRFSLFSVHCSRLTQYCAARQGRGLRAFSPDVLAAFHRSWKQALPSSAHHSALPTFHICTGATWHSRKAREYLEHLQWGAFLSNTGNVRSKAQRPQGLAPYVQAAAPFSTPQPPQPTGPDQASLSLTSSGCSSTYLYTFCTVVHPTATGRPSGPGGMRCVRGAYRDCYCRERKGGG